MNTIKNSRLMRQRGVSIIELMIALSLGLLVLFAVMQVFTSSMQSVKLQNEFSRVQENGRMAIQLLSRDIRGAGYWGCSPSKINNLLDENDDNYSANLLTISQATVAGENDVDEITIALITVKKGSDTLTLRGAQSFSDVELDPGKTLNPKAATIHIIKGKDKEEVINLGDILLIGDCTAADLFTNTKADPFQSGEIGHNTGKVKATGAIQNKSKNLTKVYGLSTQILSPYVKTYFIGENLAGGYSLYKSDNGIASELVRGVNDLQLIYIDDSGNSVDPSDDMDDVLAIRLSLVAESGNASSASTLERTYTVTVNIRNRSL